jgi:hypothetical protein
VRKTGKCVEEISDALDVSGGTPEKVQAIVALTLRTAARPAHGKSLAYTQAAGRIEIL